MSEIEKLTKILKTVVREVVREELSFTKKEIINELQNSPMQPLPNNVFKLPQQNIQESGVNKMNIKPNNGQVSLLQQMAMNKMRNPNEEFLAMKSMS